LRGDANRRRKIFVLSVARGFAKWKTAIVISPLIALMQDQVAQLAQMGIPAAVLNSSQNWNEQRDTERRAEAGEFRLLYLSPERLAKQEMIAWLAKVPFVLRLMKRTAFRMGPRIPSRLPEHEGAAQGIFAKTDCGVHCQRHPARAARHHRAT
jgi:hypothetical protein